MDEKKYIRPPGIIPSVAGLPTPGGKDHLPDSYPKTMIILIILINFLLSHDFQKMII
jgi:hypothetical protein